MQLKADKARLALSIDEEEEAISNRLQRQLDAAVHQKEEIATRLESESEYIVNHLQRQMMAVQREKSALQRAAAEEKQRLEARVAAATAEREAAERRLEVDEAALRNAAAHLHHELVKEKVELENAMEMEQEAIVMRMQRQVTAAQRHASQAEARASEVNATWHRMITAAVLALELELGGPGSCSSSLHEAISACKRQCDDIIGTPYDAVHHSRTTSGASTPRDSRRAARQQHHQYSHGTSAGGAAGNPRHDLSRSGSIAWPSSPSPSPSSSSSAAVAIGTLFHGDRPASSASSGASSVRSSVGQSGATGGTGRLSKSSSFAFTAATATPAAPEAGAITRQASSFGSGGGSVYLESSGISTPLSSRSPMRASSGATLSSRVSPGMAMVMGSGYSLGHAGAGNAATDTSATSIPSTSSAPSPSPP